MIRRRHFYMAALWAALLSITAAGNTGSGIFHSADSMFGRQLLADGTSRACQGDSLADAACVLARRRANAASLCAMIEGCSMTATLGLFPEGTIAAISGPVRNYY